MDVSSAQRTPTVQEGILKLVQTVRTTKFLVKEQVLVVFVSFV